MKELFQILVDHSFWANKQCLKTISNISEDQTVLKKILGHTVASEAIYLQRISGKDPFPQNFWPLLTINQMSDEVKNNREKYALYLDKNSETDLLKSVRYRTSQGTYFEAPIFIMMSHVFLHSGHHRGQFCSMMRTIGKNPPSIDLITYTRA